MSRHFSRPPFVLAAQADSSGCGYHRITHPMQILSRTGFISGRAEPAFLPDNVLAALNPDIVVCQRQYEESNLPHIERYRAALPNAHFVFEIDDALSAVPSDSWHAPYMPPNVDARLASAISRFDTLTVSTQPLADHMRAICAPGTRIRVLPNMLGREDMEAGEQIRKNTPVQSTPGKIRIGWGGGIGHGGNLALLNDAMSALKDRVEWVFLGMDPAVPAGVVKLFAGASTTERYIASLAALNVDLIVAPLHDNAFNRCKSNLRLLEAGACAYPVIASPVAPYLTDDPPVAGHAANPAEWLAEIEKFLHLTVAQRVERGQRMRQWVNSRFVLDDPANAERRLLGWLPDHSRVFKPRLHHKGFGLRVVHDKPIEGFTVDSDLQTAINSCDCDVLYIRPGAQITPAAINRIVATEGDVVCALTNDGGPWGFPAQNQLTVLDQPTIANLAAICESLPELDIKLDIAGASGPAVLLRRRALSALGSPDLANFSPEVAILEWSVGARARGLTLALCHNAFVGVPGSLPIVPGEPERAAMCIQGRWPAGQTDERALKALREIIELRFHAKHFHGLPPANRLDYNAWALQCDTSGPRTLDSMTQWLDALPDAPRLHPVRYGSPLPNTDTAVGDWFVFCGRDTKLSLDAKSQILAVIVANPTAVAIYADHDHIKLDGTRFAPDFKPNLDVHMLVSRDYVSQIAAIRVELMQESAQDTPVMTGEQVYAAFLRIISAYGRDAVAHLPKVIAHLPPPQIESLAASAPENLLTAREFIAREDWNVEIETNPQLPIIRTISYAPAVRCLDEEPAVTIIVPTKDKLDMLAPCITTILAMTRYSNYSVLIVDNGSTRPDMLAFLADVTKDSRVCVLRWDEPFNWARLNNVAASHASGTHLVFLNDDTRILSHNWLAEMVGASLVPGVGAVGAHLNYPHGLIQHVGVYAANGLAGHIHKGLPVGHPGTNGYNFISHEATAVTGACMLVSRDVFTQAGGFDERLPTNFNDVAFCVKLRSLNLLSVVANQAELQHFEGVTRSPVFDDAARLAIYNDGMRLLSLYPGGDPYWNPNLEVQSVQNGSAISGMNMDVPVFPAADPPWPLPDAEHVLLIGQIAAVSDELRDRAVIFKVETFGNALRLAYPPLQNSGPWDIRIPAIAKAAFRDLGITRVVISDLGESPIQLLPFLITLELPITYRPLDAEAACPRTNLKSGAESCNKGYLRDACQACLAEHSSPHGNILVSSWRAEWFRFFSAMPNVTVDLSMVQDPDYLEAIGSIFASEEARVAAE